MFCNYALLSKARLFTDAERSEIKSYIPDLDDKVSLLWLPEIIDSGILGMFIFWQHNNLYVADNPSMMKELASTIAHELTHRKQLFRYKLLYFVLLVPFIRDFTIEAEAKQVELETEKRLGLAACVV